MPVNNFSFFGTSRNLKYEKVSLFSGKNWQNFYGIITMSDHKLCSMFVEGNSMNKPTNSANSFTFEFLQLFSNLSRE